MQADVKTVALTAAGHRVAPAAGKAIAAIVHMLIINNSPSATHGCATTKSHVGFAPKGSKAGSKAIGTARIRLVKVKTPTEICADFRAQTNEAAWKQPESKANTQPTTLWCWPSGRPKMNSGWAMQIAPDADKTNAMKCQMPSFSPRKTRPKKAAAMISTLVKAATSPGDAPISTAITARYLEGNVSEGNRFVHGFLSLKDITHIHL